MVSEYDVKELKEVVSSVTPFHWKKYDLTVVGDGHMPDGTRVHMVKESLEKQPIMLSNALIISAN